MVNKRLILFISPLLVLAAWFMLPRDMALVPVWELKHSNIRALEELPLGPVRLRGVVTHADAGRFWLQDGSGAIVVNADPKPIRVRAGQEILLQARKTHAFDPVLGLQSVNLNVLKVTTLREHGILPQPAPASVSTLPDKDKNGIRVTVEGVLHYVTRTNGGSSNLYFGEGGQEIQAIVQAGTRDFAPWLNSRLRVTGISESVLDEGGSVRDRYIWVQDSTDILRVESEPNQPHLYSVRSLYKMVRNDSGHRVMLRGRIAQQDTETTILLEDQWGTVSCVSDVPFSIAPGTPVEVVGFPVRNGLRVDLAHSEIKSLLSIPPNLDEHYDTNPVTTVSAIRRLTDEQASLAIPVRLSGVVTFNDSDWKQLFVQDSTGGIFVKYAGNPHVYKGEKLTVVGITNPGDYAPVIVAPKFIASRKGVLPQPVAMTAKAWSGVMDGVFVEAEGVVHAPRGMQNPKHLTFDLYTSFGAVHVVTGPDFEGPNYLHNIEDSLVRVRGVGGVNFNSRKQLIGLLLAVSRVTDFQVVEPGTTDPFQSPSTPIGSLLRFSPSARFGHRVKVTGAITMLGSGFFYAQDQTGGARVEAETSGLHVGEVVDVAGFASPEGYSPVVSDAVVRVKKEKASVSVQQVTPEAMGDGAFDSELVSMDGTLISVAKSPDAITLVLRSGGRPVDAVLYLSNSDDRVSIPREGSLVRLTGICSVPLKDSSVYTLLTKARVHAQLVIRSPQDVQVLHSASWWSTQRTTVIAVGLFVAVCASLAWIAALRRRVQRQSRALQKAKQKNDAINDFIHVMQDVTRNKRFTSRVPSQGSDEIALLSTEFNQMLAELHLREIAKNEAESQLRHQALTDDLTGLPNRRLLSDRLSQVLELARRDNRIVALLYLDLDGFKLVNDSLGHTVGDMLLAEVAERLGSRIRKSDTLARLGGDEFTVVLSRLKSKEEAELVANNLLEVLSRPFLIEGHEITISASIGISVFPENGADASELLQEADSAMYSAKRDGKNRIMYFTPELGHSVRERLNIENQLRGAILRGEITVHYQPEFDVATKRLVRFEALARWHHPTLGNITPDRFIPIAEESGLIIPLGTYILEQACREALTWQGTSHGPIQVAVNVSTVQFRRETFVDEVDNTLREVGLDPKLLQLELTESIMLDGTERASRTMKRLAAMGVSIAVDDFGTGYSCFSYLPRLPFNTLKIDRAFVSELGKRAEMAAMIRSLVTLAHNLNMQVVVEGVETLQQLEAIEALGGNEVQGYLLGRPTADPKSVLRSYGRTNALPAVDFSKGGEEKKIDTSRGGKEHAKKAGV